ncbi:MAG TPA: hypothetical protein VKX41_07235 [Alloacidobacterium sp.]|nr:hypothetical protein [Alloacidobacterium sp.]
MASQFYGVRLNVVTPTADGRQLDLRRAVEQNTTVGVAIAANALASVDHNEFLQMLGRRPGGKVPLLVFGLTAETAGRLLTKWSGGAVVACRRLEHARRARYTISRVEGLTRQLTGLEVPLQANGAFYLVPGENGTTQQIAQIRDDQRVFPVCIQVDHHGQRIFLAGRVPFSGHAAVAGNSERMVDTFVSIAPVMMFVRACAGERGWHALHHYANLTIDDAWLREPYGYLNYGTLLAEMKKHNFHSTIAFIPWNYDRSEPEVVSLVRKHPERFSICVHGNNHDHKEFTDFRSKSLASQTAALREALARMERFQELTGIPYARAMVFPHSVAPEKTFAALKKYNYLATINSSNVPMDVTAPSDALFALRTATLSFAGFLSLRRYSVEGPVPAGLIAVTAFLDNPLLFYCHQIYFSLGIGAFDPVAEQVNRLQPDTRWRGIEDIVKHSYLVRTRDDGDYDVLTFASSICLENISARDSRFYVRRAETDRPAAVTVDRHAWPYSLGGGYLETCIPVASGKSRLLSIVYGDPLQPPAADIQRRSLRVFFLRITSDFRDIILARCTPGRRLIHLYQTSGAPVMLLLLCAAAGAAFFLLALWSLRKTIKKRAATR